MGKLKATTIEGTAAGGTGSGPITGGEAAGAAAAAPAIVVFGRDENRKAHASWFSAEDSELATKAAGLMGMRVLPITDEAGRAAALGVAQGRIFESGKGFVPFCKTAAYEALAALPGSYEPPAPVEPEPELPVAATGAPSTWADIGVGSLVLASVGGDDDSWWPSIVVEARGDDLYVLRWENYDDEPSFVRRGADLGLMPPSTAAVYAAGAAEGGVDGTAEAGA